MIFEIKDNDQAMDVLEYITKRNYECDIGNSISYAKAEIDTKNELNQLIKESYYSSENDTMERYLKYTGNKKEQLDNYIIENTIESITYYDVMDYQLAIQEDLLHYMREYFEKHPLNE